MLEFKLECDSCKLWYHLECLDPPLTRMPKKTSRMDWLVMLELKLECDSCIRHSPGCQRKLKNGLVSTHVRL